MLRILAVVLLLGAAFAPAAQADWAQFHGDAKKTGFQSGTSYQVYKDVWWNVKLPDNTNVEASPVVSNGIAVVGGWDKVLRAFDAASGKSKWNYTMTDKIVASPAIASGRVYAVDVKGNLASIDLQTGKEYAKVAVGATLAPVTTYEGKVFIGTEAGTMKAYDVKSSDSVITLLWSFPVTSFRTHLQAATATPCVHPVGQIRTGAAVYDGVVYFGAMNNYVYAIDAEGQSDDTTRLQWFNLTSDIILGTPAVDSANAKVYFGSYDGKMRSFTTTKPNVNTCAAALRTPLWIYSAPANAQIRSSPATDGTNVYFGTNSGKVVAISQSAGTQVWERSTDDQVTSSPAISNGIVVVGSEDNNVYWLNAGNGTILKQFATQDSIKSSPAIDGNRTFVASFDGTVYMFGPEIPKRPDLTVVSITATDAGLTINVKNQGDAASPATTVRLLVAGTFVANINLDAIDPGQSKTVSNPQTLAAPTLVKAIVDPDGTVTESVESNNERQQTLVPPVAASTTSSKGGGGFKIPGPGAIPLLGLLALAALAVRRRRVQ